MLLLIVTLPAPSRDKIEECQSTTTTNMDCRFAAATY